MSQLIVRNIEPEVVTRLKQLAASHGRSMEAEHRAILRAAVAPERPRRSFKEALLAMPDVGEDTDFARVEDHGRGIDL